MPVSQEEAAKNREQNLQEAKSITISEDTSLPTARKVIMPSSADYNIIYSSQ